MRIGHEPPRPARPSGRFQLTRVKLRERRAPVGSCRVTKTPEPPAVLMKASVSSFFPFRVLFFSVLLNSKVFSPHEESASSASSLCLGVSVVNLLDRKSVV